MRSMTRRLFVAVAMLAAVVSSDRAKAQNFGSDFLNTISDQGNIDLMLQMISEGVAHRGFSGAAPLGVALGFDVGLDAMYIAVPQATQDVFSIMATGAPGDSPLKQLVLPRLMVRKGLPGKIDLGFAILPAFGDQFSEFSHWAAEVKWSPVAMAQGLNVATRLSYTSTNLQFFSANTFAVEGIASLKAGVIEPYLGLGLNFSSTALEVNTGDLAVGIDGNRSFTNTKMQLGLNFNLAVLRLGFLYENNLGADLSALGLRLALGF